MKIITKAQAIKLHSRLTAKTGGIDGVRDEALLESALQAPFQSFAGKALYPALLQKAARLGGGLVKNHAFLDGNKRIGAHVMLTFLYINGVKLAYTQKELEEIILDTASGKAGAAELEEWLSKHTDGANL
jgi:death-on-curing protein